MFNPIDYFVINEILNSSKYLACLSKISSLDHPKPYVNLCIVADLLGIRNSLSTTIAHNRYILDLCGFTDQEFSHVELKIVLEYLQNTPFYINSKLDEEKFLSFSATYKRRCTVASQQSFLSATKQLEEKGYAVIPNILSPEEASKIKHILQERAELERQHSVAYLYGNNNSLQRIYHLVLKEPSLNYLLTNPLLLTILDHFFDRNTHHDKHYLSTWQSNILHPGAKEQQLHVDAPYPGRSLPEWNSRITVSFIIQEMNEENGTTQIVPGSHLLRKVPSSHEKNSSQTKPLQAPVGSMCLWGGYFWHKSGTNKSANPRYSLLGTFASSLLREYSLEENNPMLVAIHAPKEFIELKNILGMNHGIKDKSLLTF